MNTFEGGIENPVIDFRDVSLDFRVPPDARIATLKEWVIRRTTKSRNRPNVVQALNNVSFSVSAGQSIGIIGSNGAGKSSLLRVAAGVLQPSTGMAAVRGRIAPVIELGIGFEQELTGRENIVFNGALLGRSRQEMLERMDEIIEFAELGSFIDQPIRTYSTGMVARLAFSVATTVDATVLLLDEVLSVGDERFRLKCGQRFSEFRDARVTIVFVSHALDSVESVCDEVIWMDQGAIHLRGDASEVIQQYRLCMGSG